MSMTRYRTIVADPPWHYNGFTRGVRRGWRERVAAGESLRDNYVLPMPFPTMTVDEIAALPIPAFADPAGAALFLWTTNRYLPAAFRLLDAWGFTYSQTFVWDKAGSASPLSGHIAPTQAEYLIASRTAGLRWAGRVKSSVIQANRGEHSHKPDVFLDIIETVSPGPYVELFARRARFGWDYWGDESLGTAEMGDGPCEACDELPPEHPYPDCKCYEGNTE